jgi:serine/threonine-protein kinase RsbW
LDTLYIEIDSDKTEISKVETALERINRKLGFNNERFINLQIAVSEALVNAIVHGNKENKKKKVHVIINSTDEMVEVKVRDEGGGFDIAKLPDPTNDENLLKESGRGVYIIMSLVDEFYCNSNDEGTEMGLVINKSKTK